MIHEFKEVLENTILWSWIIALPFGIAHIIVIFKTICGPSKKRYNHIINVAIIICQITPICNIAALIVRVYEVSQSMWFENQEPGSKTLNYAKSGPISFLLWYWPGYPERAIAWCCRKIEKTYWRIYYRIYPPNR